MLPVIPDNNNHKENKNKVHFQAANENMKTLWKYENIIAILSNRFFSLELKKETLPHSHYMIWLCFM